MKVIATVIFKTLIIMKTLKFATVLTLSAALLTACHSADQKYDSKSSADSLNSMKDSVVDSSRSTTSALQMKVGKDDAKFAVEAATGGMAEVELGQLAQQKAVSPQVKDFGSMMVTDHSKANDQLKTLAKNKGITLPATLSADEQKTKDDLSAQSGDKFDKAYVKDMIKDHKEDIQSFKDAIKTLKDPDLKAFATNTLPVLEKHLDAIEKIDKAMQK
jgi:putative membrane protein